VQNPSNSANPLGLAAEKRARRRGNAEPSRLPHECGGAEGVETRRGAPKAACGVQDAARGDGEGIVQRTNAREVTRAASKDVV
jgi:hypothetical protein